MSILYGVGVGPGDPELITVKAVNTIKKCDIIAAVGDSPTESRAYKIASGIVEDMDKKRLVGLNMPMDRDRSSLKKQHRINADILEKYLDSNESVCFLTLGDPNIYSTFSYIRRLVSKDGYDVRTISGVTSFSAAASALGVSLADWDETVHIIPAGQRTDMAWMHDGTCVFMKPRGDMAAFKGKLRSLGCDVRAVVNCGLPGELICNDIDEIPDDAGYLTVMIAREYEKDR